MVNTLSNTGFIELSKKTLWISNACNAMMTYIMNGQVQLIRREFPAGGK
jgi:hypothetical protein